MKTFRMMTLGALMMPQLVTMTFRLLLGFSVCVVLSGAARADSLPSPDMNVVLPLPAANAFSVSVSYGPSDGLMYVWNGAQVLRQDAPLSSSFTSLGNVGSGSADAGGMAFSRDGSQLLLGNGGGGFLGGANSGLLFSIPSAGGNSNTAVGNVAYHDRFLAAPLGASNSQYFVDQGNASFTASSVSVFDSSNGSNVPVIANIPGASTAMTIDGNGRFYVGVGFGPQRGQLRSFSLSDLENAYNSATPLQWNSGTLFNTLDNNSGSGLFFDSRGFLFAGGPNGITVFDTHGNSNFYDNGGYTSIEYDSVNDRVLVMGYGDYQGLYMASTFQIPEPSAILLAAVGALALLPAARRRLGRRASA